MERELRTSGFAALLGAYAPVKPLTAIHGALLAAEDALEPRPAELRSLLPHCRHRKRAGIWHLLRPPFIPVSAQGSACGSAATL
jgi:hypothetical protein